MRLLDAHTLELKTFVDNIPPYAILSHCWGDEEVVFSDLADLNQARKKEGFTKLQKTCELAVADGFDYAWIDTCCIDKSSSAELSEAINSMFVWYRASGQCYAYLADVELQGAFAEGDSAMHHNTFALSKWFTRAWTLQELLAPRNGLMKFYSMDWQLLGSKANVGRRISNITGIPIEYLEGWSLETASISMRMSWAADRQATRAEDIAYSLLGIFDVNMPLLYGEGKVKAFRRLQEEIMKITEDETLFAWEAEDGMNDLTAAVLAVGPNDFRETRDLIPFASDDLLPPYTITHRGLRIWQTLFYAHQLDDPGRQDVRPLRSSVMIWPDHDIVWGILRCHVAHDFEHLVVVPLRHLSADVYLRDISTRVSLIPFRSMPVSAFSREIYIRNTRTSTIQNSVQRLWGFLIRKLPEGLEIGQWFPKEAWNEKDSILQGKEENAGPSSWHASLELNFSVATNTGDHARYMILLSLGCAYDDTVEQPQAWCRIDDEVKRQDSSYLRAFHALAPSKPARDTMKQFRTDIVTRTDLNLMVTITPAKVFSQDMFIVEFYYARP
jgi:hypothetical protein